MQEIDEIIGRTIWCQRHFAGGVQEVFAGKLNPRLEPTEPLGGLDVASAWKIFSTPQETKYHKLVAGLRLVYDCLPVSSREVIGQIVALPNIDLPFKNTLEVRDMLGKGGSCQAYELVNRDDDAKFVLKIYSPSGSARNRLEWAERFAARTQANYLKTVKHYAGISTLVPWEMTIITDSPFDGKATPINFQFMDCLPAQKDLINDLTPEETADLARRYPPFGEATLAFCQRTIGIAERQGEMLDMLDHDSGVGVFSGTNDDTPRLHIYDGHTYYSFRERANNVWERNREVLDKLVNLARRIEFNSDSTIFSAPAAL